MLAAGWKPPVPITVKARDGVTDFYGLMYQPTNLDRGKKYLIINAQSHYMMRRRWDYFVRYLRGREPPKEFELRPPAPALGPGQ